MPKVSIILAVYNREDFLKKSLTSLLEQTLKDIEIIAVNDGSTDSSLSVLKKYATKDKRIKIINQSNKGVSSAWNAGLKKATGDFIGFVDPDDYVDVHMFEKLYLKCIQTKTKVSMCQIYMLEKNSKILRLEKYPIQEYFSSNIIHITDHNFYNFINPGYIWFKIYDRHFLSNNKLFFEEKIKGNWADSEFTIRMLLKLDRISTVCEPLYYYLKHPTGLSYGRGRELLIFFDVVEIILKNKYRNLCVKEAIYSDIIRTFLWHYSVIQEEFKTIYFEKAQKMSQAFGWKKLEYKKFELEYRILQAICTSENSLKGFLR